MGPITIGVDIGQKRDPTAIAVAEAVWQATPNGQGLEERYTIRRTERLPLGTSYPHVAERIAGVVANIFKRATHPQGPQVEYDPVNGVYQAVTVAPPGIVLYVDATGVGQPVVDLLARAGVQPIAVYFTHGDRRTVREDGSIALGKGWLVSRLQSLLQTDRLLLPRTGEAAALTEELLNYEIKVSEDANEQYGAFRVGTHDDLVTAIGLATQGAPETETTEVVFLEDIIGDYRVHIGGDESYQTPHQQMLADWRRHFGG